MGRTSARVYFGLLKVTMLLAGNSQFKYMDGAGWVVSAVSRNGTMTISYILV